MALRHYLYTAIRMKLTIPSSQMRDDKHVISLSEEVIMKKLKTFYEILKIIHYPELHIFNLRHGNCSLSRVSICTILASLFIHPTDRDITFIKIPDP